MLPDHSIESGFIATLERKQHFMTMEQRLHRNSRALWSRGIKSQPITVENPWPNLVEIMCRALVDVIRAENFEFIENPMQEVEVLLSSCAWALMSTASVATGKSRSISLQ